MILRLVAKTKFSLGLSNVTVLLQLYIVNILLDLHIANCILGFYSMIIKRLEDIKVKAPMTNTTSITNSLDNIGFDFPKKFRSA